MQEHHPQHQNVNPDAVGDALSIPISVRVASEKHDYLPFTNAGTNQFCWCCLPIPVRFDRSKIAEQNLSSGVSVIGEGDPLEIFTDREGEVILKKYSPIGELGDFAKEYAESLFHALNRTALICDKDTVIAVSGGSKKEYMERPVHEDVERCMQDREKLVISAGQGEMQGIIDGDDPSRYTAQVIVPILSAGDAIGAVVMVSREPGDMVGDTELKVCETAAHFMGKQMEN